MRRMIRHEIERSVSYAGISMFMMSRVTVNYDIDDKGKFQSAARHKYIDSLIFGLTVCGYSYCLNKSMSIDFVRFETHRGEP